MTLQSSMAAVDQQESDTNVVGIGHNKPPKQDVLQDRVHRAKEIHVQNASLPTVELANRMATAQAEIQRLNARIGTFEASSMEALEATQSEYEIFRELVEAEMADAVKRRDAFIDTLNEEIAGIRNRLSSAKDDHEIKQGQIIRHNSAQIEALRDLIAMPERSLNDG